MGSKANVRRLKRVYRCDVCIKSFRNVRALCYHKKTDHTVKKTLNILRNKKQASDDAEKKSDKSLPKPEAKDSPLSSPGDAGKRLLGNVNRKIEFSCPKCDKSFNVYFSAFRHVQKYHCVDSEGKPVNPNSPNLIKPLRREQCSSCLKVVKSTEFHSCILTQENLGIPSEKYVCVGCGQDFSSIKSFDLHVGGVHNEHVQSMFFPSKIVFLEWKERMEKQIKSSYTLVSRYASKEFYRCTHLPVHDDVTHFCPSSLIFKSFSKGVQIHYYPLHFGHKSTMYIPSDQDKKFCITSMLEKAVGYQDLAEMKLEKNDLYTEFKNLMEHIVLEAAKLDIRSLKKFMGRALHMSSTLKEYDEDEEVIQEVPGYTFGSKPKEKATDIKYEKQLSNNQISNELQETSAKTPDSVRMSDRIRRKSTVSSRPDFIQEPVVRKAKGSPLTENVSTPKKFKPNKEFDITVTKPELDEHEPLAQLRIVDTFSLNTSVLNQNNIQPSVDNAKELLQSTENDKKENVTVTKESQITDSKPNNNSTIKDPPKVRFSLSQSQSFNDSYKEFVDKNFKFDNIGKPIKPKKQVMKTKIGQFLPNSPKRISVSSPTTISPSSPKIDAKTNNEVANPNHLSEMKPILKSQQKPVNNSETKPIHKNETKSAKSQIKPVKSEMKPVKSGMKSVSKSEVKPISKSEAKSVFKSEAKSISKSEAKPVSKSEAKNISKSEAKPISKGEAKSISKGEAKLGSKSEAKLVSKSEAKPVSKSEAKPVSKSEAIPVSKSEATPVSKSEARLVSKSGKQSLDNASKTTFKSKPLINKTVDIKYEVKEQENDCNILVLKI